MWWIGDRWRRRLIGKHYVDATAKATVNVRLIGKAQSGEAFALRDFLQRSVVGSTGSNSVRDERIMRLAISKTKHRVAIVQLPDGVPSLRAFVRELAQHLGWGRSLAKEYECRFYGAGPAASRGVCASKSASLI